MTGLEIRDAVYQGQPHEYIDASQIVNDDQLRARLKGSMPIRFDWENKWLRGDQYAHMLYNLDNYASVLGIRKMAEKQHPENIYIQPESK